MTFLRDEFERTRLNVWPLRALLICEQGDVSIPTWVREFLARGIRLHMASPRENSLDRLIGLIAGKGKRDQKTQDIISTRKELRFGSIEALKKLVDPTTGKRYSKAQIYDYVANSFGGNVSPESVKREHKKMRAKGK